VDNPAIYLNIVVKLNKPFLREILVEKTRAGAVKE
jgi:hypothetical protein